MSAPVRSGIRLVFALVLTARAVLAQDRFSTARDGLQTPGEIGQLMSAAVQAVLPPHRVLLGIDTVRGRVIRFMFRESLSSFDLDDSPKVRAALRLAFKAKEGSQALLADCAHLEDKPCSLIGRDILVDVRYKSMYADKVDVQVGHFHVVRHGKKGGHFSWQGPLVTLQRSRHTGWRVISVREYERS